MAKSKMDTSFLDRALKFAVDAHKGIERRGKGFPYVIHPMEVVSIVATLTNDQEILAAAALHDVVEDTDYTIEDIRREFGDRVARIVEGESDVEFEGVNEADSWKQRKQIAIDKLAKAPLEVKMAAMGDKLSNMRAIWRDYRKMGPALWNIFHVNDPYEHEWHYRGLANSLKELEGTYAYVEFKWLIDETFLCNKKPYHINIDKNHISISGDIDLEASQELEKLLMISKSYIIDASEARMITFGALRTFIKLSKNGVKLSIVNANDNIANMLYNSGVSTLVEVTRKPIIFDINCYKQSGEGFTSIGYYANDNDSMCKVYKEFVTLEQIEQEKRNSQYAMLLGIPTPISGKIVNANGRYGLIFERIFNKNSFAKELSVHPERLDELAHEFAHMSSKLHSTECDTSSLTDGVKRYSSLIKKSDILTQEQKDKILEFIESVPRKSTCLHGDFHIGNAILTDKNEKYFIDLSDFSYGNPLFDLGTFYLLSNEMPEAMCENMFHNPKERLIRFWKRFVYHYFKLSNEDEIPAIEESLKPFSGISAIYFASVGGLEDWKKEIIKNYLVNKI